MKFYQTKNKRFSGTQYAAAYKHAFGLYLSIKRKTKRRTYIRSAYFKKDKIFLDLFWQHLHQKNWRDRARRIRYFAPAIELIQNSRFDPEPADSQASSSQVLYRFTGITSDGHVFYVQIKKFRKTGQKWLVSIFPK